MQKDTWIIIGVMVTLFGLLATFMVTSLTSIESRLTAMDNNFSARLATVDSRLHEMNTRLSRIEGHLRLPTDIEPIRFETMEEVIIFKEHGQLVLEPVARSMPLGEVLSQLAPMEENPAQSLMSTGHSGSVCKTSS